MALYTQVDDQSLTIISGQYELGNIMDYRVLNGGSENTNYWLKSSTGEYVLTICEQKSKMEAQNLAYLLVHLNEHGFETSQMVQNKAKTWVTLFKDKPILVKKYIDGIISEQFSDQQMQAIGKQLAHLHTLKVPSFIPNQLGYGIQHFTKVNTVSPEAPFCAWLMNTKAYIDSFLQEDLPKALIHSDLFYNNIILEPKTSKVTVMDFEEAAFYYRIYDIGMTLVGTCNFDRKLDLAKAKQLLFAYQQQSSLSQEEQRALQAFTVYAATATAFWRYMHYNFVKPEDQHKDRYKEMQMLASQIRSIPTLEFQALLSSKISSSK